MVIFQNWVFDFLRTMVIDSKNYPNNQERHIPISNNRPTLVIAYVSGPISCKECTWLLCKWVRHSVATR